MSNYNSLKTTIDANIKQNGRQEITGQILNSVLNQMVTTLGAGYQFMGVATPETNPGTPDPKVYYIAKGKGVYANFGGLNVNEDEVVLLTFDNTWKKVSSGIAGYETTKVKYSELDTKIQKLPILVSKYAVQTEVWYGNDYTHIVIPVNGGEKVDYILSRGALYCAFLTDYTTPIENATPSFLEGYIGRQTYSGPTGNMTIPVGTKYFVINNPVSQGLSSVKINGLEIMNGVFPTIFTLSNELKSNSQRVETNNAYAICYSTADSSQKNISAAQVPGFSLSKNIRMLIKFVNGNTADNVLFEGKPLYYRGKQTSPNNSWNAGDVLDVRYEITNESFYAEPWNGVALEKEVQSSIRTSDLDIVITSKNLANPSNVENGLINSEGAHIQLVGDPWNMLKVPVTPGQILTFGGFQLGRAAYYAFYNDNTLVSFAQFNDPNGTQAPVTVTVPEGVNILYIDISTNLSPANPFQFMQVNIGEQLDEYDEFSERIESIKGIKVIGDGGSQGEIVDLIADLPVSDGTNIPVGYAYIDSASSVVKVKTA